jgi:glycosyltransferase involved in cell wall biosynthesis
MKILFALDTYYPKIDGPAGVVSNIVRILNEEGLAEAELVVPSYPGYKDTENFKIHRCPSILGPDKYRTPIPAFSSKVKNLVKNGNFDLIHIHSPFTLGKYVSKLGNKYGIPVIDTIHTQYKSDFERKLKSNFLRIIC